MAKRYAFITVGAPVFWTDPDGGIASGPATVAHVQSHPIDADTIISIRKDDGGDADVLPSELRPARKRSQTKIPAYRVKFVIDEDAQFEESNGEARPMTEAEYTGNEYRACPKHPRAGTKVISIGPPQIQGCAVCSNTEYENVPYAEYLAYYGNPERHVYLGCMVEKQCTCCEAWTVAGSLWHIDFMDDDRAYLRMNVGHYYSATDAIALPDYAGEVAGEVLSEAGYKTRARKAGK